MKKIFITICFIAVAVILTAQQWNLTIEHLNDEFHICEGCCTANNETIFVGYWNSDAYIVKIDEYGNYIDNRLSVESRTLKLLTIISLENGCYFVTGVSKSNDDDYLWVLVIDDDLNIVSEHFYEKEEEYADSEFYLYGGKTAVDDDGTIIACVNVYMPFYIPETYRIRAVYMRFNADGERLNSVFISPGEYGSSLFYSTNFEMTSIMIAPNNDDLMVIGRGEGNCYSFLRFDYDFNMIQHNVIYEPTITWSTNDTDSDHWIDDNSILLVTYQHDPDIHNKAMLVYGKASLDDGIIYDDIWINKKDTLNYTIGSHSMCTANDTTIYLVSLARLGNWTAPANMEIYLTNKNLEILGTKYFYDEMYYCPFTAITTKDYGLVTVSRNNDKRTHIKKFLREDFNPIPCSVSETLKEKITAAAYPNPTNGTLNIDISGISTNDNDVRFKIFNADGRICLDRIVNGTGNLLTVDVSGLQNGAYAFQIVKGNKTIISDKFIKE